jgi:hypothetical protein
MSDVKIGASKVNAPVRVPTMLETVMPTFLLKPPLVPGLLQRTEDAVVHTLVPQ